MQKLTRDTLDFFVEKMNKTRISEAGKVTVSAVKCLI